MNSTSATDELKEALRHRARALGFDTVGFARPDPPPHHEKFPPWLAQGCHGTMQWMARHTERRCNPRELLPPTRSIMMVGCNYRPWADALDFLNHPQQVGISAYARNGDYHDILKGRLRQLADWLSGHLGYRPEGRIFVDTAPVLEKPLAVAAGLGWQGKNSHLVSRDYGCWLFLGAFYLAIDLPPDPPFTKNHCGTCDACQRACPTDALDIPYTLDSRRCLSYYSIEHKGAIPRRYRRAMGNHVYGCDDCIAVCPWNRFAPPTKISDFHPRPALLFPRLIDFAHLDDSTFRLLFRKSPIKRIGLVRFLRNCAVALGNWRDTQAVPPLLHLLKHPHPLVRSHAVWGLGEQRDIAPEIGSHLAEHRRQESDPAVLDELARLSL